MTGVIRHLQVDEYETFMRFVERCFHTSPGAFERMYPYIYQPSEAFCSTAYVVERGGEIVSHVGLYPIEVVLHGVTVRIGGIGAVCTAASERGEGHMTRLLYRVIEEMREQGYALSWLGGDRQRYKAFGWECVAADYELAFSKRSLKRLGAEPVELEAHFPKDVYDVVARLQPLQVCYAVRPDLDQQLLAERLRAWTVEDGYALLKDGWGQTVISELVSTSGREAGMIRSLLDWTGRDELTWRLPASDQERLARLMPGASRWRLGDWQMVRIVDLTRLLQLFQPLLSSRAKYLRDAALSIGICEHDRADAATLIVQDGVVEIVPGRSADRYVEWSSVEAARVLFGGPPVFKADDLRGLLAALFPLPVSVPGLDHV